MFTLTKSSPPPPTPLKFQRWATLLRSLCSNDGVRPQDMAYLKAPSGRAIIVPNNAPAVARSSLLDYRLQASRKESVATNMLVPLVRSEMLFRGFAPSLSKLIDFDEGCDDSPVLWSAFESMLGTRLGHFSTVLRVPGPDWTPIIHLFNLHGERVAIAKVGFSGRARQSVRREAVALERHEIKKVSWITAHSLGLIENELCSAVLMSPLPSDISGFDRRLDADLLDEIASLSGAEPGPQHPAFLQQASRELGLDPYGSFEDRINADVPRGRCHGDLVPWNMAHTGGRLVLWDWEYSFQDAPLGFDAVQSRYRVLRERGGDVAESLLFANHRAQHTLIDLGLNTKERDDVCAIHGIDAAVRIAAGVDVSGSTYADALRALTVISPVKKRLLNRV